MKKFFLIAGKILVIAYVILCNVMYFLDITFDSFGYVEMVCSLAMLGAAAFGISLLSNTIKSSGSFTRMLIISAGTGFVLLFFYLTLRPLTTIYYVSDDYNLNVIYGYGHTEVDGEHIQPGMGKYVVFNASDDTISLRDRVYRVTRFLGRKGNTKYAYEGEAVNADQELYGGANNDSIIAIIAPHSYFELYQKVDSVFGPPPSYYGTRDDVKDHTFSIYYLDSIPK